MSWEAALMDHFQEDLWGLSGAGGGVGDAEETPAGGLGQEVGCKMTSKSPFLFSTKFLAAASWALK